MENILVVLAIVGSVIYKIYTSYKEEMEKAAKRKQQVPPIPDATPVQPRRTHIPTPPPVVVSKPVPLPVQKAGPVVSYEIPDEVRKVQRTKSEREKMRVKPIEENSADTASYHFDLRQAVIQSAILERPYQ